MRRSKYKQIAIIALPEAICLFATKSSYIALAWWILSDASPLLFAMTIATSELAESFFMPMLSPIIDRYKPINIVRYSVVINFFTSLALVIGDNAKLHEGRMLILMLLSVILIALSSAARNLGMQKYIAGMDPNFVTHCVAARTSMRSVITIIGPAMGGILTWLGGIGSTFALESILCLLVIIFIKYSWATKKNEVQCRENDSKLNYGRELLNGFLAIVRVKTELGVGVLSAGINFVVAPFFSIVLPSYIVSEARWLNASHLGIIDSSFGIGILVGTILFLPIITRFFGKFACVFIGNILLAASLMIFAMRNNFVLCSLSALAGGVAISLINTHLISLRLLATPKKYIGRVAGGIAGLCTIFIPIGSFLAGFMLEFVGLKAVMLFQAGILVMLVPFLFFIPNLRFLLKQRNRSLANAYCRLYPNAFNDKAI